MAKERTQQLVNVRKGYGTTGVTVNLGIEELRALKEVNEGAKEIINDFPAMQDSQLAMLTSFIDKITAEVTSPKDIYDRLFKAETEEVVNMADKHEDIFNEDDDDRPNPVSQW